MNTTVPTRSDLESSSIKPASAKPWRGLVWKTLAFLAIPAAILLFVVHANPSTKAIGGGEAGPSGKEVAAQKLVGAPFRVVWVRDVANKGHDPFAFKGGFKLMGYDSTDPRGAFEILSAVGSYRKPLLTPDGKRIVFTDFPKTEMKIVNWDGSGLRSLGRPGVSLLDRRRTQDQHSCRRQTAGSVAAGPTRSKEDHLE